MFNYSFFSVLEQEIPNKNFALLRSSGQQFNGNKVFYGVIISITLKFYNFI